MIIIVNNNENNTSLVRFTKKEIGLKMLYAYKLDVPWLCWDNNAK